MKLFASFDKSVLKNPKFKEANMVHDWRNHVPEQFIKEWGSLTNRERYIIYVFADKLADEEEWD